MPSFAVYSGTYRDIAAAFARELTTFLSGRSRSGGLDPAYRADVLVPSRGTAESLVDQILRQQPEGFSGIAIRTIDELARSILNAAGEFPRIPSDLEQQVVMSHACSEKRLFGDVEGAASALARSYRDVRDSAISIDELARSVRKRADRAAAMAIDIWRRYEQGIEQIGGIDPADVLERAGAIVRQATQAVPPQTLFGFYDLTGAQQRFVDVLASAGLLRAVYVPVPTTGGTACPPYSFAGRLLSHLSASSAEGEPVAVSAVSEAREVETGLTAATTRADELRQIGAAVRRLLAGGTPAADIGIVTRSVVDEERILFRFIAADAGFSFSGANARDIRAHRIGRGVITLLRLRERRFRRSDVIDLLEAGVRTAELGVALKAREISTIDRVTRRHRIAGGTAEQVRSSRRGRREPSAEDREALGHYVAVVEALERATTEFDSAREGHFWRGALPRLADLFHLRTEEDLQIIAAIEEVAEGFARVGPLRKRWSADDLARALEGASTPGAATDLPEVWFGDVMRLRGRSFRNLFVFGVEERRVPQRRAPDAILPDDLRRHAGVREIGDGREEEQLLFALLGDAAAETIQYSCALVDTRGSEQRPSRLLRALALQIDPAAEDEIAHDFGGYLRQRRAQEEQTVPLEAGRRLAAQLLLVRSAGQRTHYDGYLTRTPELTSALREKMLTIAPTHLEEYGECPQRFFFSRILGAREIEDPEDAAELQVNDRGILWHEVLEEFYQTVSEEEIAGATSTLTPPLETRLHSILDRMYDELDVRQPPLNRAIRGIERRAAKRILSEFVTSDLGDLQRSGFRPWKFEYRFGRWQDGTGTDSDTLALDVAGYRLELHGVIDRIDRQVWQRKYRVVDYKSGKARRFQKIAEKIDAGQALQLALYTLAVAEMLELEDHQVSGVIRPLVGGGVEEHFAFELAARRTALESALEMFLQSISDGVFPAFVAADAKNCRYCAVNHSCRTRYAPNERYALATYESVLEMLRSPS